MIHVSSRSDSPHYSPCAPWLRVFFNGAERKHVIEADEGGRRMLCYQLDEDGNLKRDPADNAVEAWEYGAVSVLLQDCAPQWAVEEFAKL